MTPTPAAAPTTIDDDTAAAVFGETPAEPTAPTPAAPMSHNRRVMLTTNQDGETTEDQPPPDFATDSPAKINADQAAAASVESRAERRAALALESTAPAKHAPAATLASLPEQIRAIWNNERTAALFTRCEREQITGILHDRAAGMSWDEASQARGAGEIFIFWANTQSPAIRAVMDSIDLQRRAATTAEIEDAAARAAQGKRPRKGRDKPDTRAAALWLSGNDTRYKAGQQAAAPVVNIQINT